MPTFPSNPSITSRLSTGSALTYTQMDTNFGNLTASIDSVISVSRTASYVDSSNIYYTGTSQSFWSASISSSTINTATVSTLNVTNFTAAGTTTLNGGLTIGAGVINGNITGSVFGTASWASNAITASHATTASYVNTLTQNIVISGSLFVTGSPVRLVGLPTTEPLVTGSLWLSGSGAGSASGSKYLMVFTG
jgi:hypothetical protein